ncbi:uncharacterized protein PHACADRAFT_151151 [Phanerochaete carnosa HHB-10118-sp]|uniref:Uncharacterized protein n=1 Tax=Phanerochaete carnosa (strain HHB-10118-sp) TaxID=650164 RepID=K5WP82_PHACS|nr:uncharacterized protein PHACADRAFT_151151 [Phanerochaete carnosa HHB-10118-sp]EKM52147.1 hypothetical protein PHACADRAFT_151151 [Phanerochaete carnosa HHB-10118-sp]
MDYAPEKRFRTTRGFLPLGSGRDISQGPEADIRKTGSSAYHLRVSICIALHVLLILIHVAFLLVSLGHYERSVSFAITPFSLEWYPLIVTTLMQVFGTIFLAVLVAYTQSLAFRSDLYVRQTLTSLHDKSNAWLGLGAACGSLWDQFKLRAAMVGVVYITVYLLGVWLLHITIPTALNVVPFNATAPTVFSTVLANTTNNADYASAYDILPVYDQVPMLGLQDNMVYDIIPSVPSANGTATVNASVYNVDCAALPHADSTIQAFDGLARPGQPNMTWLIFNIDNSNGQTHNYYLASLPYSASAIYTAQVADIEAGCSDSPLFYAPGTCWAPIVILSTVTILDSDGNQASIQGGPWRPINPQVIVPPPNANPAVMITAIQLLACSVQITNAKIEVAVDTRTPVLNMPKLQPNTLWKNWTWPDDPALTDQLRAAQAAPYFSPPSGHSSSLTVIAGSTNYTEASPPVALPGFELEAFQVSPFDENPIPNAIMAASAGLPNPVIPTAFDVFMTEDLRIVSENRTNVTITEINYSLEKALAATFWYGNQVNYSSAHAIDELMSPASAYIAMFNPVLNLTSNNTGGALPHGEATIAVSVQRLRLNVSLSHQLVIRNTNSDALLVEPSTGIIFALPSRSLTAEKIWCRFSSDWWRPWGFSRSASWSSECQHLPVLPSTPRSSPTAEASYSTRGSSEMSRISPTSSHLNSRT